MDTEVKKPTFEGWAVLELMGHRRLGGRVSEATMFGGALLRIDIPGEPGQPDYATQFYGASSIYCLTPCSEEAARAVAKRNRPEPVATWELPKLPAPKPEPDPDDGDEYERPF